MCLFIWHSKSVGCPALYLRILFLRRTKGIYLEALTHDSVSSLSSVRSSPGVGPLRDQFLPPSMAEGTKTVTRLVQSGVGRCGEATRGGDTRAGTNGASAYQTSLETLGNSAPATHPALCKPVGGMTQAQEGPRWAH